MRDGVKIRYTRLAAAFVDAKSTRPAMEDRVSEEIDGFVESGGDPESTTWMHAFEFAGHNFILLPQGDGTIVCDTCTFEASGPPLDAGPFKGKTVMVPVPDSEDRDE